MDLILARLSVDFSCRFSHHAVYHVCNYTPRFFFAFISFTICVPSQKWKKKKLLHSLIICISEVKRKRNDDAKQKKWAIFFSFCCCWLNVAKPDFTAGRNFVLFIQITFIGALESNIFVFLLNQPLHTAHINLMFRFFSLLIRCRRVLFVPCFAHFTCAAASPPPPMQIVMTWLDLAFVFIFHIRKRSKTGFDFDGD